MAPGQGTDRGPLQQEGHIRGLFAAALAGIGGAQQVLLVGELWDSGPRRGLLQDFTRDVFGEPGRAECGGCPPSPDVQGPQGPLVPEHCARARAAPPQRRLRAPLVFALFRLCAVQAPAERRRMREILRDVRQRNGGRRGAVVGVLVLPRDPGGQTPSSASALTVPACALTQPPASPTDMDPPAASAPLDAPDPLSCSAPLGAPDPSAAYIPLGAPVPPVAATPLGALVPPTGLAPLDARDPPSCSAPLGVSDPSIGSAPLGATGPSACSALLGALVPPTASAALGATDPPAASAPLGAPVPPAASAPLGATDPPAASAPLGAPVSPAASAPLGAPEPILLALLSSVFLPKGSQHPSDEGPLQTALYQPGDPRSALGVMEAACRALRAADPGPESPHHPEEGIALKALCELSNGACEESHTDT